MELHKVKTKRITVTTVRAFIRKNQGKIFINVKLIFDGMQDGMAAKNEGFLPATETTDNVENTFGIMNAWFTSGTNYIVYYDSENYTGFSISNACAHFILAIKKE